MKKSYRFYLLVILSQCFAVTAVAQRTVIDSLPPQDTVAAPESLEREAYFPGGNAGWIQYLQNNLNPNVPVEKGAPAGRYTVMVQFIVDANGNLSDFKALTRFGYGMEQEVLRIIRKSPPWIPAIQNHRNVKAYRKQPVTFQIVEEKKKKRRSD